MQALRLWWLERHKGSKSEAVDKKSQLKFTQIFPKCLLKHLFLLRSLKMPFYSFSPLFVPLKLELNLMVVFSSSLEADTFLVILHKLQQGNDLFVFGCKKRGWRLKMRNEEKRSRPFSTDFHLFSIIKHVLSMQRSLDGEVWSMMVARDISIVVLSISRRFTVF